MLIDTTISLAITGSFIHTTEFFVIMAVVAAAIVALCARPSHPAPVREHLVAGICDPGTGGIEPPQLLIRCLDGGDVWMTRTGYTDLGSTGAVSLAVDIKRFDINIRERVTPGQLRWGDEPLTQASFNLDFLAPEWYHVYYTDEATGLYAGFNLHVRPGLTMTVPLRR